MKKTLFILGIAGAVVLANVLLTTTGCSPKPEAASTASGLPNSYARLPVDITDELQNTADSFSWLSFIAMNWPANGSCGPDTTNGASILSGKGPVVWETYLSTDQVFVAPPATPAPWCTGLTGEAALQVLPPSVQALARQTGVYRTVHRVSKFPNGLAEAVGGPLVDQNGRFVRYEVRVNQDEYNYFLRNRLWSLVGQKQFVQNKGVVNLPVGQTLYGRNGAMEFKAAWKILGANDDTSRFYRIRAIVYNDSAGDPSPGRNPVLLGLVGLHIAHKTPNQRNWVWSTFEQVDNLTRSFFNSRCDTCKPNQPITGPQIELNPNGTPRNAPTQVVRVNPAGDADSKRINAYFQRLLRGSVWANYQLVNTQWMQFGDIEPQFLANSVQETFVQGPNPPTYGNFKVKDDEQYFTNPHYQPFAPGISASCMGCHYVATLPVSSAAKSDFSFLLGEAR